MEVNPDWAYPLAGHADGADGGSPVAKEALPTVAEESSRATTESLPLDPADANLIASWSAALRARGWAASSIQRAAKRVRAFARSTTNGLVQATREDLARFAMERADGQDLHSMMRTDTWRKSADALHDFYRWAERRRLLPRRRNPIRGIRRLPPASTNGAVDTAVMRKYDKLLHYPRASHRDRAIIWLLAHGLTPHEVSQLRPVDVDLDRREVRVRVPGRASRSRLVPLSEKAAAVLEPWVLPRLKFGHTWLFQGARRGRPPSSQLVRQVVHRLAAEVFGPQWQDRIGQGLHPCGFRDVFITRAIRSRIAPDCLVEILGLDRISRLRRYTEQTTPERLHAEVRRLTSRSRGWI